VFSEIQKGATGVTPFLGIALAKPPRSFEYCFGGEKISSQKSLPFSKFI
jgi:hypothetical protein